MEVISPQAERSPSPSTGIQRPSRAVLPAIKLRLILRAYHRSYWALTRPQPRLRQEQRFPSGVMDRLMPRSELIPPGLWEVPTLLLQLSRAVDNQDTSRSLFHKDQH